jgi:hypothetical protein
MRRIHRLVLALAASASIGYAFAQSSAPSSGFAITDSTLTPMAALYGGAFGLEGHIGQPLTGKAGAGSFQLSGGFTPTNTSRIFANGFEP